MSDFDHGDLPPELSYVADQLRSRRYEASPLELDQAKERIIKRAGGQRAARGGGMRKRTFLTAVIMFAAIGTGSAAALAVSGVIRSVPFVGSHHQVATAVRPPASAALAMYGNHPSTTVVICVPSTIRLGQSTTCKATVTGATHPTGTVTFASNVGGTFVPQTCTLHLIGGNQASCTTTFTPRHTGSVKVYANYSGDAVNAPSHGSTLILVIGVLQHASTTTVICVPSTIALGKPTTCKATVTGATHPTGTVTFASNVGGTFVPQTCTLVQIGGNQASCTTTFTPRHTGSVKVYANYSGDAANAPSHGSTTIVVTP